MTVLSHFRLLPLLVIVSLLSFVIRLGDYAGVLKHSGMAYAQHEESPQASPPSVSPQEQAESEKVAPAETKEAGEGSDSHAPPPVPGIAQGGEKVEWRDAGEEEFEYSPVQEELYKDLSARRKELEKKEKEFAVREALLKAGERELDQKLRELTAIRNEIAGLLTAQSEEQKARIQSLVTIYEGMKAKDAARIFNTLDIDVLITVLTHMSERKSAAIMAEMSPDRARTVTILMAQQSRIPEMPAQ